MATILIPDHTTTSIGGVVTDSYELESTGDTTTLELLGGTTFEGSGSVTMTDEAANQIVMSGGGTLTNVDDTIAGGGSIYGQTTMTLVNDSGGVIDGNTTLHSLAITSGVTVSNAGLIEATGAGGLAINNDSVSNTGTLLGQGPGKITLASVTVHNSGGIVSASGAGGQVDLESAIVQGGTLETAGGGTIDAIGGGNELDGTANAVTNSGGVVIQNRGSLMLLGTIHNSGSIALSAVPDTAATSLLIGGSVTLDGGGTVTMTDQSLNQFLNSGSGAKLINVDNTIMGAGAIAPNTSLTLINEVGGVIDGTATSNTLHIAGGVTVSNAGLIETTASGGLRIDNDHVSNTGTLLGNGTGGLVLSGTTVSNSGGTIEASGTGAHVDIQGAAIQGGTLETASGGVVNVIGGGGNVLDGSVNAVTNSGGVVIQNRATLLLSGTIHNSGSIALSATPDSVATSLQISGGVTLDGGGTVTITDQSLNQIINVGSGASLTNVDNTIAGGGKIAPTASMTLVNDAGGVVDGNVTSNALQINSGVTVSNAGLMEATGSGGLQLIGIHVSNTGTLLGLGTGGLVLSNTTVSNSGGTIEASGTGAHVDLRGGTIQGGTLETASGGVMNVIGAGNNEFDGSVNAVINSGGVVIQNRAALILSGTIHNSGSIALSAVPDSFATSLVIGGGATLDGGGTVTMTDENLVQIVNAGSGATFTNVDNTIAGAGGIGTDTSVMTLVNDAGGVIDATGTSNTLHVTSEVTVSNTGLIETTGSAGLQIDNDHVSNTGTLLGHGTGGLVLSGTTVSNAGGIIEASGTGAHVDLHGAVVLGGTVEALSGGGINPLGSTKLIGVNLNVMVGGTVSGAVLSGGIETVSSGGTAIGTTVSSGGKIELLGGANASSTTINPGATLEIAAGFTTGSYAVGSGVSFEIGSGGVASNTQVSGGGVQQVDPGGAASGTTVSSGGSLTVSSGGTLSGAIDVLNGGTLAGSVTNNGTVTYDIGGSATFGGTLTGSGTLVVSGGGHLTVASAYTGSAQIDDASTLEFTGAYVGAATFSGSPTGSGGTLKFDAGSTGPITVVNSNDTVIAQPGSGDWINAAVSYTLPANIDTLFLFAGAQGAGNSDAAGNALYALDTVNTQTLTGNSANDAFVVYNSSDVVVPKPGSHDTVYAAASYTLPTGVDALFLEGTAAQGTGNSDAAGDALYAANPGQVATLTGNSANDVFVVYNSADVVVPKAASHDSVYSAESYTLPTGVDVLFLEAGTQGAGNSDASGDALYAADAGIAQTLTGNSANDVFVVYNSSDVVVPKAGSHDSVYAAVNYTLPTGVDTLFLEAGTQGAGNGDAAGDVLYAANAGIAQTLTGNSHNDTFVVYNSGDTVIGQVGSTDAVYAAASFTLPTNVDTLFLEGSATQGTGNSDTADTLYGNGGVASTLVAGSGADTLYVTGTAGTILTGGTGADTFAFPNAMGHDEVTNFGLAKDMLQFNATLFSNFTAAMNAASQVGANTVFTIDANDTVTLDNVTKSSLTAGSVHFV